MTKATAPKTARKALQATPVELLAPTFTYHVYCVLPGVSGGVLPFAASVTLKEAKRLCWADAKQYRDEFELPNAPSGMNWESDKRGSHEAKIGGIHYVIRTATKGALA